MKTRVFVAAVVVASCCIAVPAFAEKGDMRVQFGLLYNLPTGDLSEPGETLELDDSLGGQVGFEYMVTDTIGIEPEFAFANHCVEVNDSGIPDFELGDIDYRALMANVNLYVLRQDKIAVFVGPTVGYVFWGDLDVKSDYFGEPATYKADGQFAFGVNAGVHAPFGDSKWAFSGELSYQFLDVSLQGSPIEPDLGVDPVQLRAGVSVKF